MSCGKSASHIPILVAIGRVYNPRRVLEIGSGELSTPLFLNKKVFPGLESLVSVEADSEWFQKIHQLVSSDPRIKMLNAVPSSIFNYDLIFIDGPQDQVKRIKTITFVMRDIISPVIAIHDLENPFYRRAVNKAYYDYLFTGVKPWTGVYHKDPIPATRFNKIKKVIPYRFDQYQENWQDWLKLFKEKEL